MRRWGDKGDKGDKGEKADFSVVLIVSTHLLIKNLQGDKGESFLDSNLLYLIPIP
jgi:hypothetical protein